MTEKKPFTLRIEDKMTPEELETYRNLPDAPSLAGSGGILS